MLLGKSLSSDDAFVGMEWMAEKIDLSELDLDSLIGSCSSDVSPNSPEVLLPSLDPPMDLDLDPFAAATPSLSASATLVLEEDAKSESLRPPAVRPSPPAPAEPSDLLDEERTAARPLGSLPPAGSVVAAAPADEKPPLLGRSVQVSPPASEWDSDSGIESLGSSPTRILALPVAPAPTAGSSRTKPYARPQSAAAAAVSKIKPGPPGAPKPVEKKLKKMEQNKTAATRYRHKKRVEQDLLSTELEELEKKNGELAEKAESISREIKYLKDLMEEVRKHHRGKTSSAAS